jgi:hypothetical protein
MKHLRTILACSLSLAIGISVFVADASASSKKSRQQSKVPSTTIPLTFYGMHVNQIGDALPPTGWFGQQRFWDTQTNWYELEPNPSVIVNAVARTSGTSTLYVTFPSGSNWVGGTVFVNVVNVASGAGITSFNGLYTINTVDSTQGTITYLQQPDPGNVIKTNVAGSANNFDFSQLDQRLAYAAAPNLQVMYTFGKVPAFYSSNPTQSCNGTHAPDGSCVRPNDLNADGTGSNQHWRLFVAGLAEHIAALNSSTYIKPAYFETWNEFDGDNYWHYNNPTDNDDPQALVRLMDDAACIIKGTGAIHVTGQSCAADPNFVKKAVLPSAKILPPCVSSPVHKTPWANFYNSYSDATANADIIGIHVYGYADNIQSIAIGSISRLTGTVTVQADGSNYKKDKVVMVSGVGDPSFDGTFTVTSATGTIIQYSQTGLPDASSGGGHIQNGPDQLQAALSTFRSTLSPTDRLKPFWVTEGYWGDTSSGPPTDLTTQEGYIVRFFTILWSTGVARANWYTWDGGANLWDSSFNSDDVACDGGPINHPLCNPPLPYGYVNPLGQANRVGQGWLLGNTMTSPCSATGSVWTCGLQTAASQNELMVWDSAQDRTGNTSLFTPSVSYNAYIDLSGTIHSCSGSCNNIPIGAKPILFVNH